MGRNNKSIHLLRGNKNNNTDVILDSGQPFYDKYSRSIYVGDGNTSLSSLTPVSGGWDYMDEAYTGTGGFPFIPTLHILSKIKTAGFLHCSDKGRTVAIQGLANDDRSPVLDIWHLIYIHNSPNSTLEDGAILAIGDDAGVFYGNINGSDIKWGRLTNQNRLSYTGSNTNITLGKDSLVPSSKIDLGSKDKFFNTVYANYFSIPGQCLNFRYDSDTAVTDNTLDVRFGYECLRPNGNKMSIDEYMFMDGSGEDSQEHLTWIRPKGITPYSGNRINFNVKDGYTDIVFGHSGSPEPINTYYFLNGQTADDGVFNYADIRCKNISAHNISANEIKSAAISYDGSGNIDNTKCHYFTILEGKSQGFGTINLPEYTKGAISSSGGDCALWYASLVGNRYAGFLVYNSSSSGGGWDRCPIEAPFFNATSDKRLKENIIPFTSEKSILDLPVYTFNFKSDENKKKHIGCLAQDLQEICPDLVNEDSQGYLSIEESKITYLLLEEVKELKKQVEELEEKLNNEEKISNNGNNLGDSSNMLGDR